MGSICSICGVADDPDVRRHNTESQRLIRYPDITSSLETPSNDRDLSYSNTYNNNEPSKKKSSVADRLAQFESNNKEKTQKKSKTNKKNKNSNKTMKKPQKKWTVKGIDDKPTTKSKKPVNSSNNYNIQRNIMDDEEPSVSLSHKERMKLYQTDLANVQEKEKLRTKQHKESRGGYAGIKVSSEQKEMAKKLLEERVKTQKKGDMSGITLAGDMAPGGDIELKSDQAQKDGKAGMSGQRKTKKKKRTLNELLKDATSDDARNIISSMKLIHNEYDNKQKRDVSILNMNNNNMMSRLTDEQKMKFIYLVGHSIIDMSGDKIERVTMCNTGIEDKLMMELMRILVENANQLILSELWLESNKIGDDGMDGLCQLIECNLQSLTVIKLYNNKKDVSTKMCNKMIDSLDKNDKIIKFTFEWRLQQQKHRVEKLLKRNQELRRKSRFNK